MTSSGQRVATVIGIDCATQPNNVGLARARFREGRWHLTDAERCSESEPPEQRIVEWLNEDANERVLLALDAPLGWPIDMQRALPSHVAGAAVDANLGTLFNRETDRFVRCTYGQRPLEVGANLIARTAFAALAMLQAVRDVSGCEIPLAWNPGTPSSVAAIEVYPAATLLAHGVRKKSMKDRSERAWRRRISSYLTDTLALADGLNVENANGHVLDAAVCVVAGTDFVAGHAHPPSDAGSAQREGWIWVRRAPPAQVDDD